jgi:hypothetical protein
MFTVTLSDWYVCHEYVFPSLAEAFRFAKANRPEYPSNRTTIRTPLLCISVEKVSAEHVD